MFLQNLKDLALGMAGSRCSMVMTEISFSVQLLAVIFSVLTSFLSRVSTVVGKDGGGLSLG